MKKLLMMILTLGIVVVLAVTVVQTRVYEDVTSADLPQDVYQGNGDTASWIEDVLLNFMLPFQTEEDRFTLVEEYVNLVILQSVHESVNADYAPLDDTCTETACDQILDLEYIVLTHAYATLNNDNQLVLTIGLNRASWPALTTALHLTFDVDWSLLENELELTLVAVHVHDTELSIERLNRILSYFDKDTIESSVTRGTLDLDEYRYTTSLLPE